MGLFSKLLKKKEKISSNFLFYTTDSKKSDIEIYKAIFAGQNDIKAYNDLTIARLRARTGVSMEDAKILLG